jgi:uncharacterized protein (DUF885 family)
LVFRVGTGLALRAAKGGLMNGAIGDPASALDALAGEHWQRQVRDDYFLRQRLGLPVETIRPLTVENAEDDASFGRGVLERLRKIDPECLDWERRLTYRALAHAASQGVAYARHFWLRQQITPYAGGANVAFVESAFKQFVFAQAGDAARYEALLHQYAAFVRALEAIARGQHQRGIVLPNVEIDAAAAVFEAYARDQSSLIPGETALEALAPSRRTALREAALAVVADEIVPAFASLAHYLGGPYREGAPQRGGLSQYPGGADFYRHLIVENTTLTIEPDALHEWGLREVAELNERLGAIASETNFSGSLDEFRAFLATDSRFFPETREAFGDLLEGYAAVAAEAAPSFFARFPKAPYGVAPLPEELAASQTFGYYDQPTAARPSGRYLYNAWRPERTSTLTAGALICHELVPGHHFQIALQQENESLTDLRRYDFGSVGFIEGWGEYAAELGGEMGVYRTPYDRAGRIMQDMMVSVRLVVDTGMNYFDWSREGAMEYMRRNLTLSETQIETESLRYSTDIPAQALAYKTGERTMLQLRERARATLGSAFDIRKFHGWLIDHGSMTLDTLREHVDHQVDAVTASA